MNDGELAAIAAATYDAGAAWAKVYFGDGDADVWCGLRKIDGAAVLAFRGSLTLEDWCRDMLAIPCHATLNHADLGQVHAGFFYGLENLLTQVLADIAPETQIWLTGHSLGAARALLMAALMRCANRQIQRATVFGPPRPGMAKLTAFLSSTDLRLFQNLADPVCDVPMKLALLPYEHPRSLIPINENPRFNDPLGRLAVHRSELYAKAFTCAAQATCGQSAAGAVQPGA